jgi:hypothetical protein
MQGIAQKLKLIAMKTVAAVGEHVDERYRCGDRQQYHGVGARGDLGVVQAVLRGRRRHVHHPLANRFFPWISTHWEKRKFRILLGLLPFTESDGPNQ